MLYQNTFFLANLESLKDHRIKLSQSFFKKILSTNSCLHTLLPPERNNKVLSKLHNPLKYLVPYSRTKRYQPFFNYALAHFQNSIWLAYLIVHFILWTVYCVFNIVHFMLYHRPTVLFILPYIYQSSFLAATVVINACLVMPNVSIGAEVIPAGSRSTGDFCHKANDRLSLISARHTVSLPAPGHHGPLVSAILHSLVTEVCTCEQLARSCFVKVEHPIFNLAS